MARDLMLFAGNSNPGLTEAVASYLKMPMGSAKVGRFSDGEIHVEVQTSVRDCDVFVLQSLCSPVNDNLMELMVLIDALRRASARRITAVIPYFGYARQDRQPRPRTPITAKLVADMLEISGVERVIAMDLHAGQIQGFFTRPFDHLYGSPVLLAAIQQLAIDTEALAIVSPDAGGVERARHYSKVLHCPMAIVDKRRSGPNVAEVMHLIGDVRGRDAVIVDDMIDTAGTLTQAAAALREHGARRVFAVCTHPVLSGPAIERISASVLDEVVVTDTIPLQPSAFECEKLRVVSVGEIIGEAILRVHGGNSVSSLFVTES